MATIVGRLLATVGVDTKGFDRGLKRVSGSVSNLGRDLTRVGAGLTAGVTAPLVAMGAAAVKAGGELERSVNRSLAVLTDRPADAADQLRKLSIELSERFPRAASEIAESFRFLAAGGLSFEDSMKALPTTLGFAEAGMFDLKRAVDIVTDVLAATGGAPTDLQRFSDLIVKGTNLAQTSVEELAQAVTNKAGPAFRSAGQPAEELVAALLVMAEQGVRGAEAGTQLGIAMRELQDKADLNADAFKALGIEVFDSSGNMRDFSAVVADLNKVFERLSDQQKVATARQLGFSVKSGQFLKLLEGQTPLLQRLVTEVREYGGTTDRVANENIADAISQLKILGNLIVNAAAEGFKIFEADIKAAIAVLRGLIRSGTDVIKVIAGLPTPAKNAALAIAAIAAAAGPALLVAGALTKAVIALRTATISLAAASGIGLLIGALAALVIGVKNVSSAIDESLGIQVDFSKKAQLIWIELKKTVFETLQSIVIGLRDLQAKLGLSTESLDNIVIGFFEMRRETERAREELIKFLSELKKVPSSMPGGGGVGPPIPARFETPEAAGPPLPPDSLDGINGQLQELCEETRKVDDCLEQNKSNWQIWADSLKVTALDVAMAIKGVYDQLVAGIANSVANAIVFGEDLSKSLIQTLKQAAAALISTLIQLAAEHVAASLVSIGATQVETQTRIAGATASGAAEAISAHAGIPFIGLALGLAAAAAIVAAIASQSRKGGAVGRQAGFEATAAAEGGIFSRPTLTVLGEGREPEGVAPFSKFERLMGDGPRGRMINLILELDGRRIAERTVELLPDVVRVQGIFTS